MYAFTTRTKIPAVDFKHPEDAKEPFYWRKHPNLHGWMEQLYFKKRGFFRLPRQFNLAPVRLDLDDMDLLEMAIKDDALPHTIGFFFGASEPGDKVEDLKFIQLRKMILA
jgi:hypothetical protein